MAAARSHRLARGGGSIEDLWEFNEKWSHRAIFHCAIDRERGRARGRFYHCRFRRRTACPTPSAAAELVVPDFAEVNRRIDELQMPRSLLRNFFPISKTRCVCPSAPWHVSW